MALFASMAGAGALFLWLWQSYPAVVAAYLGSWIFFTLYSAPPARLKTRGLPGLVADACGSTLFPSVLAMLLASQATGIHPNITWLLLVAAWSLAWGLRGIVWHQLVDFEPDRIGSVRTFAQRHGERTASRLSTGVAFPIEIFAFGGLLWQMGSPAPALMLLLYIAVAFGRQWLWQTPRSNLFLAEYYDGLLPLALVLGSGLSHSADWVLVIPLLLFFGRRPAGVASDGWHLVLPVWKRIILTLWYCCRARVGLWRRRRWMR